MQRESMEIALVKYNKKTWCKSALLGFFVGLAVIVPGISGSTVAIIFKLYDQFLYALGNLFKKFKQCFLFLLPIGIGIVIGVLLGFIAVKQLLEILPFAIVCLFAGLMSGAFPAVKDELKGAQRNAKRVALFCLGLLVPVALGCFSAVSTLGATETVVDKFADVQWWHVLLALVFGAVVGITQIVPGLSASAFLMSVGWFGSIMQSVSMTYWKSNPQVFLVYAGLVVGFVVGLSLGSILSRFCNGDIVETYLSWSQNGASVLDIVLGVVLFALGAVGAYLLVRYQRKKDAETAKTNAGD